MSTILKCKMCGGDIEVSQDMIVGKCLYCGSTMTLPKIESEKKARMFNRAHEYRLNCEFDKAYDAYKTITEEDEQEAEAYWGMILSEYGVEYVEDSTSGKRIPTCHRTQIQSVLDNTNYKLALRYSSGESKFMYQDEAEVLDTLQLQIISISSKIEPYDVFICYKEMDDESGERTKDSVLAETIYNELEKQGVRTFFARISLEEHLGENYEPFIYAALKSARVMILVSTKRSHCEAVWVKNEWSRFLHFMEEDDSKVLIPVYQDMNAYDFPNVLSKFQMQDMSKIGAVLDLSRGIKKILGTTHSQARDARIDAIVAAQQEQSRQNKTLKKLFVIPGVSLVILVSFVGIFFVWQRKKLLDNNIIGGETISVEEDSINIDGETISVEEDNITIDGEIKSIEVNTGYPDREAYDIFSVQINKDNYDEYIEIMEIETEEYGKHDIICPRGADKGWILIDYQLQIIGNARQASVSISPSGDRNISYPDYGQIENWHFGFNQAMPTLYDVVIEDIYGKITFISLNRIDKWELENNIFGFTTELDIEGKPNHILDSADEWYYIPAFEKYIPEKRVNENEKSNVE